MELAHNNRLCQLLVWLKAPCDGVTFLSLVTTLFPQTIPGVFPDPQPGISGILWSILTTLIIVLSVARRGCVLVRTVHKSWLHYEVMCVRLCVLVVGKQSSGSLQVSCGIKFMMVPVSEGLARLCTKERNMSSVQNEPYVHIHTHVQRHTPCVLMFDWGCE